MSTAVHKRYEHGPQADRTSHNPLPCIFVEYAQVLKMLGNGRIEAQCFDGEKRLAHIRGKMRKKVCPDFGRIFPQSLRAHHALAPGVDQHG